MAFCKFSPSFNSNNKVVIDSAFITDFLPKAPDLAVKVYLMGLNKCGNDDVDNTIEYFSNALNICEEDVSAFENIGTSFIIVLDDFEDKEFCGLNANKICGNECYWNYDRNTNTLEVIGLGTRSVRKVLQEERDLLVALENYK